MGKFWVSIYYVLFIYGIHFQHVPLYTLYKISVLIFPLTGENHQRLEENYESNVAKNLGKWEGVELMPQVAIYLNQLKGSHTLYNLKNVPYLSLKQT